MELIRIEILSMIPALGGRDRNGVQGQPCLHLRVYKSARVVGAGERKRSRICKTAFINGGAEW